MDRFGGWHCPRRGPIRLDGDTVHPQLVVARVRAVVARLPPGHRLLVVPTSSRGCVELMTQWANEIAATHTVHALPDGRWEVHVFMLPVKLGGVSTPTLHERRGHWTQAA